MEELTKTAKQAIKSVLTLRDYRNGNERERAFHNRQIKNGKLFVVVKQEQGYAFAPSKFAGYKANNVRHEQKIYSRDGPETNVALTKIFGAPLDIRDQGYVAVDQAFQSYCAKARIEPSKHHRARRYWIAGKSLGRGLNSAQPQSG